MIETLLFITAGFAGGLFYSKGKKDPVASAMRDAKKGVSTAGRAIGKYISRQNTKKAKNTP